MLSASVPCSAGRHTSRLGSAGGSEPVAASELELLRGFPCVTVGVGDDVLEDCAWDRGLDVLVARRSALVEGASVWVSEGDIGAAALDMLLAGISQNPLAALSYARLLHATAALDTWPALLAESATYSALLGGGEFKDWLARTTRPARDPDPAPAVRFDRAGGRLVITLDRPSRRNAFGRRMRDELIEALQMAELDETIEQVNISGAGPAFCAGGDLAEFGDVGDPAMAHAVRITQNPAVLLARLHDRVSVSVHGPCVGAGIELPAFADRIEANPDARFRLPEVGMGLIPGAGGTVSIPRRVGRHRAAFLGLSGAWLGAESARRWGLIDAIVP